MFLFLSMVMYAKKVHVVSDTRNMGLVDFAVGLVNAVVTCNSPNGQVKFFGEFKLQKNCDQ